MGGSSLSLTIKSESICPIRGRTNQREGRMFTTLFEEVPLPVFPGSGWSTGMEIVFATKQSLQRRAPILRSGLQRALLWNFARYVVQRLHDSFFTDISFLGRHERL